MLNQLQDRLAALSKQNAKLKRIEGAFVGTGAESEFGHGVKFSGDKGTNVKRWSQSRHALRGPRGPREKRDDARERRDVDRGLRDDSRHSEALSRSVC